MNSGAEFLKENPKYVIYLAGFLTESLIEVQISQSFFFARVKKPKNRKLLKNYQPGRNQIHRQFSCIWKGKFSIRMEAQAIVKYTWNIEMLFVRAQRNEKNSGEMRKIQEGGIKKRDFSINVEKHRAAFFIRDYNGSARRKTYLGWSSCYVDAKILKKRGEVLKHSKMEEKFPIP